MVQSHFFTSHFLLQKDGTLGRWPVVEMSDNGEVLSVEIHPEGLKERAGLQLHGGLLMSGMMDVGPVDSSFVYTQRVLNRHFSNGTLFLGSNTSDSLLYPPPFLVKNLENVDCPLPFLVRDTNNFQIPLLERIRQFCSRNPALNWLDLICEANAWIAGQRDDLNDKGSVEAGQKSGLLVIKNLDLNKMAMTGNMSIKWLSFPTQK